MTPHLDHTDSINCLNSMLKTLFKTDPNNNTDTARINLRSDLNLNLNLNLTLIFWTKRNDKTDPVDSSKKRTLVQRVRFGSKKWSQFGTDPNNSPDPSRIKYGPGSYGSGRVRSGSKELTQFGTDPNGSSDPTRIKQTGKIIQNRTVPIPCKKDQISSTA